MIKVTLFGLAIVFTSGCSNLKPKLTKRTSKVSRLLASENTKKIRNIGSDLGTVKRSILGEDEFRFFHVMVGP